MFNFVVALLAAAAWTSTVQVDAASVEEVDCSSYLGEPSCLASGECQWFLGACIAKPATDCAAIRKKDKCSKTWGCNWYPETQWWLPTDYVKHNYGDFNAPVIGCDTNTMCSRLTVASWCNKYSHCSWVDGECKTFGTPADPNWVADCSRVLPRRLQNCLDLGPQCKYVNMKVCNNKGVQCDNVLYGCRRANWCNVSKGPYVNKQCKQMGDLCTWQDNKCAAVPTTSPTLAPSNTPTLKPSNSPTKKPTTGSPSKSPTRQPTSKSPTTGSPSRPPTSNPTAPTTFAPTKAPTTPTTLAPTLTPTTGAPTRPSCPYTTGAGAITCPNQPFAQLETTFAVPVGTLNPGLYCNFLCSDGANQGAYATPTFPGCRSWTYDGSRCHLFSCFVGGSGTQAAVVTSTAGVTYGVPSAQCFSGGMFPTPAPTITCLYTNENIPPRVVADSRPIAPVCRLGNVTVSKDFVGTPRTRLDWCQTACTNDYPGCTAVDMYDVLANGGPARCIFANCLTLTPGSIFRTIYRSQKTATC